MNKLLVILVSLVFLASMSQIGVLAATPETPWKTNENGTLYTGDNWNMVLGYDFIPNVDGQVTKLGAYVDGTKNVLLWDWDNVGSSTQNNAPVRQVQVTGSYSWNYSAIAPYPVRAGHYYTVAVYLQGSGGSHRNITNYLPQIYGNIRILRSRGGPACADWNNCFPLIAYTQNYMYGQVDIEFIAGALATPTPVATATPAPISTPVIECQIQARRRVDGGTWEEYWRPWTCD